MNEDAGHSETLERQKRRRVRLGDYLSAVLQEWMRAQVQANLFGAQLARDLADETTLRDLPVRLYEFGESTVRTKIAVVDVERGRGRGRRDGKLSRALLVRIAGERARSLPEDDATARFFRVSDNLRALWQETYVLEVQDELEDAFLPAVEVSTAATVFGVVVSQRYTQLIVDEESGIPVEEVRETVRGDALDELRTAATQLYRKDADRHMNNSDRQHADDLDPIGDVNILVSADDLSQLDADILTTLEITLEGKDVRWEMTGEDEGGLVRG